MIPTVTHASPSPMQHNELARTQARIQLRNAVHTLPLSEIIETVLEAVCSPCDEITPANVLPGNHSVTRGNWIQLAGLILAHRGFDGSIDWGKEEEGRLAEVLELLRDGLDSLPEHPDTPEHSATDSELVEYDEEMNIALEYLRDTCQIVVDGGGE